MILVTGGAGYIGSHTCVELIESGYDALVLDNLSNSCRESLHRVERLTDHKVTFVEGDVRNGDVLDVLFDTHDISAVIHFAGLKAVGESCECPISYYENNIECTLKLVQSMQDHNVKNLVFSSSATVYGDPQKLPLTEDMPLSATNPYGRSKLIIEEMLRDLPRADELTHSDNPWSVALLRYFNPVGAHKSGQIGEDPNGIPNNLMPFISQTAIGKRECLSVFGNDYSTRDGTGVRDYIHVVDLAKGHVKAVQRLLSEQGLAGVQAFNLGTGRGISVLEMVNAFKDCNHVDVPYRISDRRPGDVAACYADVSRAQTELGWKAELGLADMVKDSWRWQSRNPEGYRAGVKQ